MNIYLTYLMINLRRLAIIAMILISEKYTMYALLWLAIM